MALLRPRVVDVSQGGSPDFRAAPADVAQTRAAEGGLKGHLHTFRHAFISAALTKGTPEAVVRRWVGHVDPEILNLYTHIADQASQEAMRRLAKGGNAMDQAEERKDSEK